MDFLRQCISAATTGDLALCKPVGLGIVDWITIAGAVGGAGYGVFRVAKWIFFAFFPKRKISSFKALRRAIYPLMTDNSQRFLKFGPNSGLRHGNEEMRFDLSVWRGLLPKIDRNNQKIAYLIRENEALIPQNLKDVFNRWLAHIDAFHVHVNDSKADYRRFQFPSEVVAIINGK